MTTAQNSIDGAANDPAALSRCVEGVLEAFDAELAVRIPRSPEDRRNEFAPWLARVHALLLDTIQALVRQEFAATAAESAGGPGAEQDTEQRVWTEVAEECRRWAVRGLAVAWVSRQLGEATTLGQPERTEDGWRVPLGVVGYGENLGQVILDPDGNVVPESTTTRDEILQQLNGRSRTPAATTAGQ